MDSLIQSKDNNILTLSTAFLVIFILHYASVIFFGEINFFNKFTYAFYSILISLVFFYEKYYSNWKIDKYKFQIVLWVVPIYFLYSFLINKSSFNFSWFIGDFLVFWGIIFSISLGIFKRISIVKEDFISRLMFFLFIILLIDFVIIFFFGVEGKIRSFSRLIIVPSFYLYQYFKTKNKNNLYIFITCFFLAIISNMRYAFIIMLMMIMIYTIYYYKQKIMSFLSFKNILIGSFFFYLIISILDQNNILERWSFNQLFVPAFRGELGIVNVFLGRYYEVIDAYNQHINQFNIGSIFFGNGLGAYYEANEYINFFVKDFTSEGALSEDMTRHIIHFGPMRFYFRYGILGIGLIIYIFYKNFIHLGKSFRTTSFDLGLFYSVTTFLYLLRFILQPIFNDIMILFCLLGFFSHQNKVKSD